MAPASKTASASKPAPAARKINLALQGGGAHGAFTWGVLDRILEDDRIEMAKALLEKGEGKIVLPLDTVVTDAFDFGARTVGTLKTVPWDGIGAKDIGVDIGEKTRAKFAEIVKGAKTVVWNGPMGVFEMPPFDEGTKTVAQAIADSDATSIIGGGDSAAAAEQSGLADKISHISTGGGASLEFLEGKILPGVAALDDK